jgi:hypothetical protein
LRLSKHFTLSELTRSQTAKRNKINNNPSGLEIESLRNVSVKILEPIRDNFGVPFSPSSGYRSKELNFFIGGSQSSQHCKGEAVDIEVPGVSNLTLCWWIRSHLDFDQLILEYYDKVEPYSGWVHVSLVGPESKKANRREVLSFDGDSYSKGIPG